MTPLGKFVLALLPLVVLVPQALGAVEVSVCAWTGNSCDLNSAAATALVGDSASFTGFEGLVVKGGAYDALCVGTVEADCPSDTCKWNATTRTCTPMYDDVYVAIDALGCPGSKGYNYIACVLPTFFAMLTGTPATCGGACSDFNYTDPGGQSMATCVPTSDLSSLPAKAITKYVTSALSIFAGGPESKYEPDFFGCCPGYIIWKLGSNIGCGAARTKAACGKRGMYSTFCEWSAEVEMCTPSEARTFTYGQRPMIANAVRKCESYKARVACTKEKIALPDHATLLEYIGMPNPQPRKCPVNFWDAVKAWGRPR